MLAKKGRLMAPDLFSDTPRFQVRPDFKLVLMDQEAFDAVTRSSILKPITSNMGPSQLR